MLKQTITYIGFDGKEKTRDFYFNLTKGEITEIHLSLPGGLDGFLQRMNDDPSVEDVVEVFKKIILKAYGKRTASNGFIKSKEISEEFAATDAYSELFLKFLDNEEDFVNKFLEGAIVAPPGTLQKIIADNKEETEATVEAAVESLPKDI